MKINFKIWKKWQIALLIFAAYNLIVIIHVPSLYVTSLQRANLEESLLAFARLAVVYNLWALITPFVLWLGWLVPVAKPHFFRNFFLHFLFALGVGFIHHCTISIVIWNLGLASGDSLLAYIFNAGIILRGITGALINYPVVIISQRAYLYFRESKERAVLQKQAELSALQAQLHPHFFFNTLNALSALIYRSPKEADRMITQLGDLFRILLKKDTEQEITLSEELEFLEAYLQIHKTLMGERLQVEWKIEPETLNSKVPNLILQLLVENSVKHGLAPLEEGGRIEISAVRQNGHLRLEVKDSGIGIKSGKTAFNNGIGLSNTQARLRYLYGEAQEFKINQPSEGGTRVMIKIPFQTDEKSS